MGARNVSTAMLAPFKHEKKTKHCLFSLYLLDENIKHSDLIYNEGSKESEMCKLRDGLCFPPLQVLSLKIIQHAF